MSQTTFELGDGAVERTFSVGELTTGVNDAVRRAFPEQVWVKGEVQNHKRYPNGHTYFSLVEKAAGQGDRVKARLDCVLFRDDRPAVNRALKEVPGAELGNDVEVRIRGRVGVYAVQGRLQFVMSAIDPVFTVGGIAANRERVLRALAADGLLDAQRSLAAPARTATRGPDHEHRERRVPRLRAGVGDERATRSRWARSTCVCRAPRRRRRIVWALHELSARSFDVVVVVRGGGSRARSRPVRLRSRSRVRSPRCRCRCSPASGTRSTAASPTRSRTPRRKTPTACAQILVHQVRLFVQSASTTRRSGSDTRPITGRARGS